MCCDRTPYWRPSGAYKHYYGRQFIFLSFFSLLMEIAINNKTKTPFLKSMAHQFTLSSTPYLTHPALSGTPSIAKPRQRK